MEMDVFKVVVISALGGVILPAQAQRAAVFCENGRDLLWRERSDFLRNGGQRTTR